MIKIFLVSESYIQSTVNQLENNTYNLNIQPNKSRSSGFGLNLIYLSISKSYASAFANGETKAAHEYRLPIKNGVLFYVCLDNIYEHFGGDIWIAGYKDDISEDIISYKNEWNSEENYSEHHLDKLTRDFLTSCNLNEEPSLSEVNMVLEYIEKNDLSIITPLDWSSIQEQYGGYSEVCLKSLSVDNIIKVEIYQNGEIIKTINGNYKGECEILFYHGSPLIFWKHLL